MVVDWYRATFLTQEARHNEKRFASFYDRVCQMPVYFRDTLYAWEQKHDDPPLETFPYILLGPRVYSGPLQGYTRVRQAAHACLAMELGLELPVAIVAPWSS